MLAFCQASLVSHSKRPAAAKASSVPMPNKDMSVKSILAFYAANQQQEKMNKRRGKNV